MHEITLEPWWTRWISMDWGFEHPSAVLWHSAAPDGCIVTYREFVQNHLSPKMLAAAIAERNAGDRIGAIYLSPDAFAQRTSADTVAEQLAQALALEGLPHPEPADNDRIGGWMLMYELLREDAWLITSNCTQLIETLPTLTRDTENIEDVLKCAGDDVCDAARYGIKSRMDPSRGPWSRQFGGACSGSPAGAFTGPSGRALSGPAADEFARRSKRITAEDPTSRAIWLRKAEHDARRKTPFARAPRRWRV